MGMEMGGGLTVGERCHGLGVSNGEKVGQL